MIRRRTEILLCRWLRPHHFILLMGITAFLAFASGYGISVGLDKVSALFPYISDTGTTIPASSVFGLLLNMSAVFGIISIYIRHSHFENDFLDTENHRVHIINDVAMFLGVLSCFGLMIVACFPWTEIVIPHLVGAMLVFVFGNIYCWLQCNLTYVTIGGMSTRTKFIIRVILAVVSSMTFLFTILFAGLAKSKTDGKPSFSRLHWNSTNPGFADHLGSTFSEWFMAISFLFFFFTYYNEFKRVESNVKFSSKPTDNLLDD